MTDEEGKNAKDTCPFNTPVYKLLLKYEANILNEKINP